jgi:adenylate cyclase class 2
MKTPPVEKEVKFYINDLKGFEHRLLCLGAKLEKPRSHELNYRFDTSDLRLTRSHQVLRLRQDDQIILTYKGPSKPDAELRIRTEIELVVNSFDQAVLFLEALGYTLAVQYEKWRTVYRLNDLEITLDEMPYGRFSEIEGDDEGAIRKTAASLALDWENRINESYLALFFRLKKKLNLPVENLTFAELKDYGITAGDLGVRPADVPYFL